MYGRVSWQIALALGCLLAAGSYKIRAGECDGLRAQDEFWRLSTRNIGCVATDDFEADDLVVSVWDRRKETWRDASWEEFVSTRPRTKFSIVYVHGNRVEPGEDTAHGWEWYRAVLRDDSDLPPLRMVLWSWPSSQIRGQLRDVRVKYQRALWEVGYVGWFLEQLPEARPLMLIGFSYGGLIVPGALNQTALSTESASANDDAPTRLRPWGAVLVASAEHHDWLLPGHEHGAGLDLVRRMLVFVNGCDPALKRFKAVDRCTRPIALGYVGLAQSALSERQAERYREQDVSGIIGRMHSESPYRHSSTVMASIGDVITQILPSPRRAKRRRSRPTSVAAVAPHVDEAPKK